MNKPPHIKTQEEILEQVTRENRTPTDDEITAMTAEEIDSVNDALEQKAEPLQFKFYQWSNLHADGKAVFLASSVRDCMAFEAVGMLAAEYRAAILPELLEDVQITPPRKPVIIALGKHHRAEAQRLYKALKHINADCYVLDPYGKSATALEAFNTDPERFRSEAERMQNNPTAAEYLSQMNAAAYVPELLEEINQSRNRPAVTTGFNSLDRLLTGGLRKEMIVLYAPPNIGKSALLLQIADQIAARAEKDVLFVALEMSKAQHMARSISRFTEIEAITRGQPTIAKTAVQIADGAMYKTYTEQEREAISKAIKRYQDTAKHMYFYEALGATAADIEKAVRRHIDITGNVPVIVLDYLQILSPADSKAGTREATEDNIRKLHEIVEDCKTALIVISAVNRESYKGKMHLGSAKETGLIEYAADKVLVLEFQGQNDKTDMDEEKARNPRRMQLRIVKQRDGASTGTAKFNYYPKYNYFTECV